MNFLKLILLFFLFPILFGIINYNFFKLQFEGHVVTQVVSEKEVQKPFSHAHLTKPGEIFLTIYPV